MGYSFDLQVDPGRCWPGQTPRPDLNPCCLLLLDQKESVLEKLVIAFVLSDERPGDLEDRGNDEAPWRYGVRIGDREPELLLPGSLLLGLLGGLSTTSTPDSSAALVS